MVNDVTYRLAPGDSFCFQSSLPHSYSNPGETEATIIVVNSPPSL